MNPASSAAPCRIMVLARGGAIDGSQRQVYYLLRELDRTAFDPIVVLDRAGPLEDSLRQLGLETHIMPLRPTRGLPTGFFRFLDARRLARLGASRQVRLVHAASDVRPNWYAMDVGRRLAVPSVLHMRGPLSARGIAKLGMARASAVIAIGQRYVDALSAAGVPQNRLELVYDSVDLDAFSPSLPKSDELRHRLGLKGSVLVGLVGRVEPFKRVLEFIDGIAPLASANDSRASFVIIGQTDKDEYNQSVREKVRALGLEGKLAFAGRCENMPAVLSELDMLVSMSWGSVMYEAMACGKPVLSVLVNGKHSEHTIADRTAWCVTTDSPGPFTAALTRLIDDPALRQRLGQAARAYAQQHLSPATMAQRTQGLYRRLVTR